MYPELRRSWKTLIISSINHPKVHHDRYGAPDYLTPTELTAAGLITIDRAEQIIDALAENHGFQLEDDCNYWLRF